jgi:hypothetical protein
MMKVILSNVQNNLQEHLFLFLETFDDLICMYITRIKKSIMKNYCLSPLILEFLKELYTNKNIYKD